MSSEPIIFAENLGKAYKIYHKPVDRLKEILRGGRRCYHEDYWAVRDVHLEICRSETIGIVGQNGAGKTTLLKLLAGTLRPSSGRRQVRGRVAPILALGTGFNPEFTGRENILTAASVMGLSASQIRERTPDIVDFADIGEFIEQPMRTYSSGMYSRVAFALAAHVDADVLIVDEALAVGDIAFVQKCMTYIRNFRKRGTLLLASHSTQLVLDLCDRVIWLDEGRVREDSIAKEVCHHYAAYMHEKSHTGVTMRIGGRAHQRPPPRAVENDQHVGLARNPEHGSIVKFSQFDPNGPWWGEGDCAIFDARLCDERGDPVSVIAGGEVVEIRFRARATRRIPSPVVGFEILNARGAVILGDNSFSTYSEGTEPLEPKETLSAVFRFHMPQLPTGTYSIVLAMANGSGDDFVQQYRANQAIVFEVHSSRVIYGTVGIPLLDCRLEYPDRRPDSDVDSQNLKAKP